MPLFTIVTIRVDHSDFGDCHDFLSLYKASLSLLYVVTPWSPFSIDLLRELTLDYYTNFHLYVVVGVA